MPDAATFVISITPFAVGGALDEAGLRGHLKRMVAAGIGVYVGGGGSGEGYTLSRDEMKRVLDIAVAELKGKVPVRAMGVEPRTAAEMIAFLDLAHRAGVDAAQIYSLDVGHAHLPTNAELDAYFSEVLGAAKLPVVLSTHKSVGYRIPAPVIADLARRYPTIIGVNCSHPDLDYLASIIDAVGTRLPVLVGGPEQGLVALALGGHGYLSSEGNLAPRLCVAAIDCHRRGDHVGALGAFRRIIRLSHALYGNGGIRVTKAVLDRLHLPGGYPRKPRLPSADEQVARALDVVTALGLKEIEGW